MRGEAGGEEEALSFSSVNQISVYLVEVKSSIGHHPKVIHGSW